MLPILTNPHDSSIQHHSHAFNATTEITAVEADPVVVTTISPVTMQMDTSSLGSELLNIYGQKY